MIGRRTPPPPPEDPKKLASGDKESALARRIPEKLEDTAALAAQNATLEREAQVSQKLEAAYQKEKDKLYNFLIATIDVSALAQMNNTQARREITEVAEEIIQLKNLRFNTVQKQSAVDDVANELLGYGPLETLLARDDIADIMVNGAEKTYIEVKGRIEQVPIRFRSNQQLLNICQRIVSHVGRRVDESSPICDARLPDGSRVNVIVPPLALEGPTLTIRKFKKDKLKLKDLINFGAISPEGAEVLSILGQVRCNILISGGTGSGKTTLLNCLTGFIDEGERVITCEDAAELQLQQPHVVRLETRPPSLEGKGEITMRDLVRNCLRMRPERIIVGEVRGPEAFDLLQAMNTGHDGSMGTIHANSPREAIGRIESMIAMGGFSLPAKTIREMIASSVNVIVQAMRLRDGSRRITHITEIVGLEGETVVTQDLLTYKVIGEDSAGKLKGIHAGTGIVRPVAFERARYYNRENDLRHALEVATAQAKRGHTDVI